MGYSPWGRKETRLSDSFFHFCTANKPGCVSLFSPRSGKGQVLGSLLFHDTEI